MQERLHIDELKRIEKQVSTLIKSWEKLKKTHAQLEEKYTVSVENLESTKLEHKNAITAMEQRHSDAAEMAKVALDKAVSHETRYWQQKYDETCKAYEQKIQDLQQEHDLVLREYKEQSEQHEALLNKELSKVKSIKDALSNRVLGVAE